MVIVLGTAKMGEHALESGKAAFARMIEASRQEEGCIEYGYAVDVLDSSIMRITEKWVDDAALAYHFQTPHMAQFQQALAGLDVKIVEVAKYQSDAGSPLV